MGLATCLLNPKIALMYAALIPQFVAPGRGSTLAQFAQLGSAQIVVAACVNGSIVLAASAVSSYLATRPRAMAVQRRMSGTVLGAFAVHTLVARRPV